MSSATLDRRIHRLESTFGSDDPRRYLGRPLREWSDAALERAIELGEEELARLTADLPNWME